MLNKKEMKNMSIEDFDLIEEKRKQRILLFYPIIAGGVCLVTSVINLFIKPHNSIIQLLITILSIFVLIYRKKNIKLSANILALCLSIFWVQLFIDGGIRNTGIFWSLGFVAILSILGKKKGLLWYFSSLVINIVLFVLARTGIIFLPSGLINNYPVLVIAYFFIYALLGVIEYNQESTREMHANLIRSGAKKLQEVNNELSSRNNQLLNDLKVAQRIQRGIIPNSKNYIQRKEIQFSSNYSSMESLGGDLYDIIKIDDNIYSFLMADVSGHGVSAALITTMAKVSFNSHTKQNQSTDIICDNVNKELFEFIGDLEHYLTAYYSILDLETGIFRYTNCGHHPAILHRRSTGEILKLDAYGYLIGSFREIKTEEKQTELQKGDRVILFTDGIIEARNAKGEFYKYDSLVSFIKSQGHLDVKDFVNKLIDDVNAFCGTRPQDDDRAILCFDFIEKMSEGKSVNDLLQIEAKKTTYDIRPDIKFSDSNIETRYIEGLDYIYQKDYKKALKLLLGLVKTLEKHNQ